MEDGEGEGRPVVAHDPVQHEDEQYAREAPERTPLIPRDRRVDDYDEDEDNNTGGVFVDSLSSSSSPASPAGGRRRQHHHLDENSSPSAAASHVPAAAACSSPPLVNAPPTTPPLMMSRGPEPTHEHTPEEMPSRHHHQSHGTTTSSPSSSSTVATPRSIGESSFTPGSSSSSLHYHHPRTSNSSHNTELLAKMGIMMKEHYGLQERVIAVFGMNLDRLLKETEQIQTMIDKDGGFAGDHAFYMNACLSYDRTQLQARTHYVAKLRRDFEENRKTFHKLRKDLREAITTMTGRIERMSWEAEQKGLAKACLHRYTLLLAHDLSALEKTSSANDEIRKYIDQVWRIQEQVPGLYKLFKSLRKAIESLQDVGIAIFSDEQSAEQFWAGLMENCAMRTIPELMEDFNKTLHDFRNKRGDEMRRKKEDKSRLQALLVSSPGARRGGLSISATASASHSMTSSPSLSPCSVENEDRVLQEIMDGMQQSTNRREGFLQPIRERDSIGSCNSMGGMVMEDKDGGGMDGEFEACLDSHRSIFPEMHAPAGTSASVAVKEAIKAKQPKDMTRSTVAGYPLSSSSTTTTTKTTTLAGSRSDKTLSRSTGNTSSGAAAGGVGGSRSQTAKAGLQQRGTSALSSSSSSSSKENRISRVTSASSIRAAAAATTSSKASTILSTPVGTKNTAAVRARGTASAPPPMLAGGRSMSMYVQRPHHTHQQAAAGGSTTRRWA